METRFNLFIKNVAEINEHNSIAGVPFTKAVNAFSDLTEEELNARFTSGLNMPLHKLQS